MLFPVALGLVGLGWGLLMEAAGGLELSGALVVPTGIAAVIVVAGILTAWEPTASLAAPVVAVVALGGLVRHRRALRIGRWPLLMAIGVLLAYGAPVLLSGQATFTGYITLDDTATWLALTDQAMSHGRSLSSLPPSTYALLLHAYVDAGYPLGSFLALGTGRALVGMDAAWVYQPYLAFCGSMVGLCAYALLEPLAASPRLRAAAAFVAAQPALLYGYSLWGGIKELTLAFLVALGAALAVTMLPRRAGRPRELLALAIVAAALIDVIGPGAAVWVVPLLGVVAAVWVWRSHRERATGRGLLRVAWLGALTLVLALPTWLILGTSLSSTLAFTSSSLTGGGGQPSKGGAPSLEALGNLIHPLSALQLGGAWPVGDFRFTPATLPTALLLTAVGIAAVGALWWSARRRHPGIALYVALAGGGCAAVWILGGTPWVVGKALAVASPAVPLAALAGGALLWSRSRLGGGVLIAIVAGGVLWSNALAYHDVRLAPRSRLAELQHIGDLVAGKGPTFIDEYDVYADRHFLRAGAPIEPAEYRSAVLPLRVGAILTKSAWADLDAFNLPTLMPYRSIVVRRSPVASRPSSIYRLVWRGRYYELWQRPVNPTARVVTHVPYGDSSTTPYCGQTQSGVARSLCSIQPVETPSCTRIGVLAQIARRSHARLVAYQRPAPIVARADQTLWPGRWLHDPGARTLTAFTPGTAIAHIVVNDGQGYELWLGGSFARGFDVGVDGHRVGRVKDELSNVGGYVHVTDVFLASDTHTFTVTYPGADLTPGSGDNRSTQLTAIVLEPIQQPPAALITVDPSRAATLCGRPLDWIEVVAGA